MKLNHINLTSTDVPGDRAMFETYFGLRCSTALGRGLAVMHDDDGMLLVLNDFSKKRGAFTDPAHSDVLHIGFLQPDRAAVDTLHARLVADGWDAPAPREYHGAWTFYFKAKGGYFVEVETETVMRRAGELEAG